MRSVVVVLAISLALASCGYPQPADVPDLDASVSGDIDASSRPDAADPDAAPEASKNLTSFSFLTANNLGLSTNVVGTIVATSINLTVPFDTSVDSLVANFQTTGDHVLVGSTLQVSGTTAQDFTNPVTYTVVADDATTKFYTVSVTEALAPLSFATKVDFGTTSSPHTLTFADLNGDGRPDMVYANFYASGISVRLNTTAPGSTTPSFATAIAFSTSSFPRQIVASDFNGDGRPDLAVAQELPASVKVLLNTTAAGATTPTFATAASLNTVADPFGVDCGDLNGDGRPDLVVASSSSTALGVLLNTTAAGAATATFASGGTFTVGSSQLGVRLADLNGDGRLDVAVDDQIGDVVTVLLNTTTPGASAASFTAGVDFAAGMTAGRVQAGDLNGDGRPDVVVLNPVDNDVSIFFDTTPAGSTTASLSAKVDFPTGDSPYQTVIRDLNGDGRLDLAIANNLGDSASVLLNETPIGATTPSFAPKIDLASGDAPTTVDAADVNTDGKPDLVVGNFTGQTVSIFLNTTAWGRALDYAAPVNLPTGTQTHAIAAGDLNGDGRKDLVEVDADTNDLSILFNTTPIGASAASFAARVTFGAGVSPRSVSLGDLNGDGRLDVVCASSTSQTISAYLNLTPAGATTPTLGSRTDFTAGAAPIWMTLGDFNTDGKLDIAVGNYNAGNLSVLLGTTAPGATTPTFATHVTFTTGMMPIMVAVGDLNGDGKPDLAAANFGSDTVSVLLSTTAAGASTPTFATKVDFAVGTNPQSVVIGDLNRDGKRDLAITNFESDDVSVLRNTTATGAATPTFATKVDFTAADAPYSSAIADVDTDGILDLIIPSVGAGVVSILRGTTSAGSTTLTFAPKVDFATGANSVMPVVADLNGDGRADLAVANGLPADTVTILLAD